MGAGGVRRQICAPSWYAVDMSPSLIALSVCQWVPEHPTIVFWGGKNQIRIIDVPDNWGPDNRGSTVLTFYKVFKWNTSEVFKWTFFALTLHFRIGFVQYDVNMVKRLIQVTGTNDTLDICHICCVISSVFSSNNCVPLNDFIPLYMTYIYLLSIKVLYSLIHYLSGFSVRLQGS